MRNLSFLSCFSRHAYLQVITSPQGAIDSDDTKFKIVVNDIKPEIVARFLLLQIMCQRLGTALREESGRFADVVMREKTGKGAPNKAAFDAFIIHQLMFAPLLMPSVNLQLLVLLQSIGSQSYEEMKKGYPFFHMSAEVWAQVQFVYAKWGTMFQTITPEIMVRHLRAPGPNFGNLLKDMCEPSNDRFKDACRAVGIKSAKEIGRKRQKISALEPRVKEAFMDFPGSLAEAKSYYEGKSFHLLPPDHLLQSLMRPFPENQPWVANVIMLPVDEPLGDYAPPFLIEPDFCPFKDIYILTTNMDIPAKYSAFQRVAEFYGEAAVLMTSMGCLSMEFCIGDMHDSARRIQRERKARLAQGLAVDFDQVYVSNVPDYTSTLPTMIHCLPLLKKDGKSALRHNVLLAPTLYKDLDQYMHTSLMVESKEQMMLEFFGAKYMQGEVMGTNNDIHWIKADRPGVGLGLGLGLGLFDVFPPKACALSSSYL